MAKLLWGKVYYRDSYAGILQEEPGDKVVFAYDNSYLKSGMPAIAYTLPLRAQPYVSFHGLPAFFDNLVSEGWLEKAQTRLLGKRRVSRLELLLAFGFDCAGAVSILDPEPASLTKDMLDLDSAKEMSAFTSRASLSGVQAKLAITESSGKFQPAKPGELSTYIAKFPSFGHYDLVENEYLTTLALKVLLPDDKCAHMLVSEVAGINEQALLIKRFDRAENYERIHFEEFNQLLNQYSDDKYEGAYKDLANFMLENSDCLDSEVYLLYRRILAGILLGNTDMHLKNFALIYTPSGLRLTPNYDQVAAALYDYKTLALTCVGASDLLIHKLQAKHIIKLGLEFKLSKDEIKTAVQGLQQNLSAAKDIINEAKLGSSVLKNQLIELISKRWNGSFGLVEKLLVSGA
jgi:serine/threonine-protein kinase HipA